ncbi:hypothetical protein Lal_00027312 [Lupinus albus]|nr:hypothetical protein Lal_00027312 [Lupinus albus]
MDRILDLQADGERRSEEKFIQFHFSDPYGLTSLRSLKISTKNAMNILPASYGELSYSFATLSSIVLAIFNSMKYDNLYNNFMGAYSNYFHQTLGRYPQLTLTSTDYATRESKQFALFGID